MPSGKRLLLGIFINREFLTLKLEVINRSTKIKDQIEIIYCKDCKFAHITYHGEVKYCDVWSPEEPIYMDADENFCSMAERRTTGETK